MADFQHLALSFICSKRSRLRFETTQESSFNSSSSCPGDQPECPRKQAIWIFSFSFLKDSALLISIPKYNLKESDESLQSQAAMINFSRSTGPPSYTSAWPRAKCLNWSSNWINFLPKGRFKITPNVPSSSEWLDKKTILLQKLGSCRDGWESSILPDKDADCLNLEVIFKRFNLPRTG